MGQDTTTSTAILTDDGVTLLDELATLTPSPAGMYSYAAAVLLRQPETGRVWLRFDVAPCDCGYCDPEPRALHVGELTPVTCWQDVAVALFDQMEPETDEDREELWQLSQGVRPALEMVGV